jgi:serpin B
MIQTGEYLYFENDVFQAIRLSHGNDRFAMYVFLLRKAGGLPDLLRTLDQPHWRGWSSKLGKCMGRIVLPKFESTYSQRLDDVLESMGMDIAFHERADFPRIHPPPPRLLISEVEHKTYIKVDEEGTEAAAATAVVPGLVMAIRPTPAPFEMVVDHPFFCAIADSQSGALLVAGVVTDPTQR